MAAYGPEDPSRLPPISTSLMHLDPSKNSPGGAIEPVYIFLNCPGAFSRKRKKSEENIIGSAEQ